MKERYALEAILSEYMEWELEAGHLRQDAEDLLGLHDVDGVVGSSVEAVKSLISKIEGLLLSIETVRTRGLSLGLESSETLKLQQAYTKLHWCQRILSLSFISPLPEVIMFLLELTACPTCLPPSPHVWWISAIEFQG